MNNVLGYNPLCSPVEAVIFNIPSAFSLQSNSTLLIPMGAAPSPAKRSERRLQVGSKAGKYSLCVKGKKRKNIKPTLSGGSDSLLI